VETVWLITKNTKKVHKGVMQDDGGILTREACNLDQAKGELVLHSPPGPSWFGMGYSNCKRCNI